MSEKVTNPDDPRIEEAKHTAELLGFNATFTTSDSTVHKGRTMEGHKRSSFGYIETGTGEIVINTDNCRDADRMLTTLLHEGVAHYGVRKLFGNDFDTFLDNVYNNCTDDIRKSILERAAEEKEVRRRSGIDITDGQAIRIGVDEYIASLAEKTDFTAPERSLWNRIKHFFLRMLRQKGIRINTITDDDLRNILRESYKNLKEGKGVDENTIETSTGTLYSAEQTYTLLEKSKNSAEHYPDPIDFTKENWEKEFPNRIVNTPIGIIRFGEKQFEKTENKNRQLEIALTKATLERPSFILEEPNPKEGAERQTSYLFVKTFVKNDGSTYRHHESVTVKQEGVETSISSHYIREKQLIEKMKVSKVLYDATSLDTSGQVSLENPAESSGIPSIGKDTTNSPSDQTNQQKNTSPGRYGTSDTAPTTAQETSPEELRRPLNQKQKQPGKSFESLFTPEDFQPDINDFAIPAEDDGTRFSMNRRTRTTVENWLKKRKDISDEQRNSLLDYLDTYDDQALQLAAGKWTATGVIRLPEDMPKVEQAVKVAKKAKVDPLSYRSPMELIERHADIKIKEERINPDNVNTLTNKRDVGNGITIYDVDDTLESRQNMRRIINTHFGKDASPWCLLQGDGEGNLTDYSQNYWDHYSAYPKRVAFRNGKLIAFSANDNDEVVWWDRQDQPHAGLPVTISRDDIAPGARQDVFINPDTGQRTEGEEGDITRGNQQNGRYEAWYPNGQLKTRWNYKNGVLDGQQLSWWDNGQLYLQSSFKEGKLEDGEKISWYRNGNTKARMTYKDGELIRKEKFYEDGQIKLHGEHNEDGTTDGVEYHPNGQMSRRFHSNQNRRPHGKHEMWYENGQLRTVEIYNNGDLTSFEKYFPDGKIHERQTNWQNGIEHIYERFSPNGKLQQRDEYDEQGRPHGLFVTENSFQREIVHTQFDHGNREGPQVTYSQFGEVRKRRNYKDDKFQGWQENYSYYGSIESRTLMDKNDIVVEIKYHTDEIKESVELRDGSGIKAFWDGNGKLQVYTGNNIYREWDADGNMTANTLHGKESAPLTGEDNRKAIEAAERNISNALSKYDVPTDDGTRFSSQLTIDFDNPEASKPLSQWNPLRHAEDNTRRRKQRQLAIDFDTPAEKRQSERKGERKEEQDREKFYQEVLAPLSQKGFTTATDEQLERCRQFVEEEIEGARSLLKVAANNNFNDEYGGMASANAQRKTANNMIKMWSRSLSAIEEEIRRRGNGASGGKILPLKGNQQQLLMPRHQSEDNPDISYSEALQSRDGTLQRNIFHQGRLIATQWTPGDRTKGEAHRIAKLVFGKQPGTNYDLYVPQRQGDNWQLAGRDVIDLDHGDVIRFNDEQEMMDFYLDHKEEIDRRNATMQPQSGDQSLKTQVDNLATLHDDRRDPALVRADAYQYGIRFAQALPQGTTTSDARDIAHRMVNGNHARGGLHIIPFLDGVTDGTRTRDGLPAQEAHRYQPTTDNGNPQAGTTADGPTQQKYDEERQKFSAREKGNPYANVLRASATPQEAIDRFRMLANDARRKADDWASRKYKGNKTFVNGLDYRPGRDYITSIGAANERRRRENVNRLNAEADEYERYIRVLKQRTGYEEPGNPANDPASTPRPVQGSLFADHDFQGSMTDDGPRFSFIGEQGAARLDQDDNAGRMESLQKAKQMEEDGLTPQDIKRQTGWEKGKEGMWKYEMPDAKLKKKWRLITGGQMFWTGKLSELVDAPELFSAYPELKDITLSFDNLRRGTYGQYNRTTHTITLDRNYLSRSAYPAGKEAREKAERVLVHEIQHAVQAIEGFARGGNSNTMVQRDSYEGNVRLCKYALDKINGILEDAQDLGYNDNTITEGETVATWKRQQESARRLFNKAVERLEQYNKEYPDNPEPYEQYRRLAGETEARNVSSRIDMTQDQRRNSPATDTEDVPRDKQVVRMDNADDTRFSSPEEERRTDDIINTAKKHFGTTRDIREAGYILPDGTLLDFSGRHSLNPGASDRPVRGQRTSDHRDIRQIAYDRDDNPTGVKTDMADFIRRGAIRIDANTGAVNLAVKPTQQQRRQIRELVARNDGDIYIDFGDGDTTDHYVEYNGARPQRVLADIDRYFDEGIKPEGITLFSSPLTEMSDNELDSERAAAQAVIDKPARIEKLRQSEPASITGNEIEILHDGMDKKRAVMYGRKLQGIYTNQDTNTEIQLQRGRHNGGISEVLQHDYKNDEHLQSVAAIPQIIEKSIYISSEPNHDREKNPEIAEFQHYACGLKIGTDDYTVHALVAVDLQGNRYYDHNLTRIEKGKLLDHISGKAVIEGFGTTPGTKPTTNYERKVNKLISILQTNPQEISKAAEKIRQIDEEEERRSNPQSQLDLFSSPGASHPDLSTWRPLDTAKANIERARQARREAADAQTAHRADREKAIADHTAIKNDPNISPAQKNRLQNDLLRRVADVRSMVSKVREGDRESVKAVTQTVLDMADAVGDGLTRGAVKRIMHAVENATTRRDVKSEVDKAIDVILSQVTHEVNARKQKLLKTKSTKLDPNNIRVAGQLDEHGQRSLSQLNDLLSPSVQDNDIDQLEIKLIDDLHKPFFKKTIDSVNIMIIEKNCIYLQKFSNYLNK